MRAEIEAYAAKHGLNRHAAIIALITKGLAADPEPLFYVTGEDGVPRPGVFATYVEHPE